MYYTYMLRCKDNSIYTGITTDVERRMHEHFSGENNCSKYTSNRKPVKLECAWSSQNRTLASKLEYHIKNLTKKEKEKLIINKNLGEFLKEKLEIDEYQWWEA